MYPRLLTNKRRRFSRSKHTLDDFVVAGVNLAVYGLDDGLDDGLGSIAEKEEPPSPSPSLKLFELYENFDIGPMIQGNESYWDLMRYHRDLQDPALAFYQDKVAHKRWMMASGVPIPRVLALFYKSELVQRVHDNNSSSNNNDQLEKAILDLLPPKHTKANYAVKPTHKSCSSGVWLVKYDEQHDQELVSYGGADFTTTNSKSKPLDRHRIASRMVQDLSKKPKTKHKALLQVQQPGVVVEERFTTTTTTAFDSSSSDLKPAVEFKCFMIWGRVWMANWHRGSKREGLVYRNGTVVDWKGKKQARIPKWVDFGRVVTMVEHLGAHKSFFRADVFVGVPATTTSSSTTTTKSLDEQIQSVQYVITEVDIRPVSTFGNTEGIFDEAARLWMAGYLLSHHFYRTIPNTEIPQAFRDKGILTEHDAKQATNPKRYYMVE